jgi:hypothetical protein
MNLSEDKKQELYNCIHENILDLRIRIKRNSFIFSKETIDEELFNMENYIWIDQCKVLKIQG